MHRDFVLVFALYKFAPPGARPREELMQEERTRRSLPELARAFAAMDLQGWLEDAFVNSIYVLCAPMVYLGRVMCRSRTDPYYPASAAISGATVCLLLGVLYSWFLRGLITNPGTWVLLVLLTAITAGLCWLVSWIGRTPGRAAAEVWGFAFMLGAAYLTLRYVPWKGWLVGTVTMPVALTMGARWMAPAAAFGFRKLTRR